MMNEESCRPSDERCKCEVMLLTSAVKMHFLGDHLGQNVWLKRIYYFYLSWSVIAIVLYLEYVLHQDGHSVLLCR